jgi:hypothetical protein
MNIKPKASNGKREPKIDLLNSRTPILIAFAMGRRHAYL